MGGRGSSAGGSGGGGRYQTHEAREVTSPINGFKSTSYGEGWKRKKG